MGVYAYARVSTDRQEHEETILSQLAELRVRANEDAVTDLHENLDEGYSRDTLVRPGLDSLRDLAVEGEVERLYIPAPDRLASGAQLVVLVEELQKYHVEIVFLKSPVEDTPEGKLLLHMQGAIGEYERTKISERTRRGKLYWSRQGALVGGSAPYGYRFVRRVDSVRAHLEIDEVESLVVQQMYQWLVDEQMSTRALAMRLTERRIPTKRGARQWQPTAVDRILKNTVYRGERLYQQTRSVLPGFRINKDPYRAARKTGTEVRPPEEWISIPVPQLVDTATWEAAQARLQVNARMAQRNNKRHPYLLRGLIRCPRCGSAYVGYAKREHRGYRCIGAQPQSSSTGHRCEPGGIPAQPVEDAVWEAITGAFQQPDVLVTEYARQLAGLDEPTLPDA